MPTTGEVVNLNAAVQGEPEWWLRRLLNSLYARQPTMRTWENYYSGRHPLSFFDDAIREKFGHRFRKFASNFTALAVDTLAERLEVSGFRYDREGKDEETSDLLWEIWQDNNMESESLGAHTDALVKSVSYVCVEPNGTDSPIITVEDPLNTIVELSPKNASDRRAALKQWIDPDDGSLIVYVYLPDGIYKYRSSSKWPEDVTGWPHEPWRQGQSSVPGGGFTRYSPGSEDWPLVNSLGVVPVVPLLNRPRHGEGRSEVDPITSNQDLINYYRAMAVVAGRYVAIPQRWVKNLDVEIDPATGQPKPPFGGGLMDLWVVPGFEADDVRATSEAAQTEFGQFAASDVTPYLRFILTEVRALAANVGVPYYYLLDQEVAGVGAPSGESIKASEARLTRKMGHLSKSFGVGWREVERISLLAMGNDKGNEMVAEARWAPFSTMNDAVVTDAVVKQYEAGLIDDGTALELLGHSLASIKKIQATERRTPQAAEPKLPSPPVPAAGSQALPAGSTTNGAGFTASGGVS